MPAYSRTQQYQQAGWAVRTCLCRTLSARILLAYESASSYSMGAVRGESVGDTARILHEPRISARAHSDLEVQLRSRPGAQAGLLKVGSFGRTTRRGPRAIIFSPRFSQVLDEQMALIELCGVGRNECVADERGQPQHRRLRHTGSPVREHRHKRRTCCAIKGACGLGTARLSACMWPG
jgi:hypothetical protein